MRPTREHARHEGRRSRLARSRWRCLINEKGRSGLSGESTGAPGAAVEGGPPPLVGSRAALDHAARRLHHATRHHRTVTPLRQSWTFLPKARLWAAAVVPALPMPLSPAGRTALNCARRGDPPTRPIGGERRLTRRPEHCGSANAVRLARPYWRSGCDETENWSLSLSHGCWQRAQLGRYCAGAALISINVDVDRSP